jgi:hypothetical protein
MTASINPNNVIEGPANVWVGAFGVTEPAQTNAAIIMDPGAGWTFIGATQGGVTWEVDHTITTVTADQAIDDITARATARNIMLNFSALEPTLATLQISLNNFGTISVGTGITVYDPGQPTAATPLTWNAFLIDGWAPLLSGGGAARRRGIFRKVSNQPKVAQLADPAKQSLWAVSAKCFRVSDTISPYIVMDQTA